MKTVIKCWIIRGLFLFLLTLCAAGWGYSFNHSAEVFYLGEGSLLSCTTSWGVITFEFSQFKATTPADIGLGHFHGRLPVSHILLIMPDSPNVLGLGYFHTSNNSAFWSFSIPYWLLMLLAAIALILVWRKTRRPHDPATAFPMQTSEKES